MIRRCTCEARLLNFNSKMKTLIYGGTIVNEGHTTEGYIIIDGDTIEQVAEGNAPQGNYHRTINATGCMVMPGVIDTHVHFRDPGLTAKADMLTESRAAAYGGVTSYFDMPNTKPQTTTIEALEQKIAEAQKKSHVNYAFFFGATNDNINTINQLPVHRIPGVKLFMGSSTGNMLVDDEQALRTLFSQSALPIMAHCEDTNIINQNMAEAQQQYGADPDVCHHPEIRSAEACYKSTALAVKLATDTKARLHVAHVSTARELQLFGHSPRITAEAVIAHLMFSDADYATLGTRIKCNPAIKTRADRDALRQALNDGRINTIGTDHAPHLLHDKQGGCARAASGMPMVQFSLVSMLELVDKGVLTATRMVELMCHNPARLFEVSRRGFLRPGYKADIAIVAAGEPWTVTPECIQSKCGWSPMEGHTFRWHVAYTICNGQVIYDDGKFDTGCHGEPVMFRQ